MNSSLKLEQLVRVIDAKERLRSLDYGYGDEFELYIKHHKNIMEALDILIGCAESAKEDLFKAIGSCHAEINSRGSSK